MSTMMSTRTTNVSQKKVAGLHQRKYTDNHYINVGFVGTVSAGKTTALNMIHSQTFEDMHIKRTTTALKIYKEDPYALINDVTIRERNAKINVEARKGKSKIDKMVYHVPKVQGIKSDKDALFAFYDFPGLGELDSKESVAKNLDFIYDKYFHELDIAFYILDINQGFNMQQEMDAFKKILGLCAKHDTKLSIFVNKMDCMYFEDGKHIINSEEVREMWHDIVKTVKIQRDKFKIKKENFFGINPISCMTSYIYRILSYNPNNVRKLDNKYIDEFGANEFGNRVWRRMKKEEKYRHILTKKDSYHKGIKDSGFGFLVEVINKILRKSQIQILARKLYFKISKATENIKSVDDFIKFYNNTTGQTLSLFDWLNVTINRWYWYYSTYDYKQLIIDQVEKLLKKELYLKKTSNPIEDYFKYNRNESIIRTILETDTKGIFHKSYAKISMGDKTFGGLIKFCCTKLREESFLKIRLYENDFYKSKQVITLFTSIFKNEKTDRIFNRINIHIFLQNNSIYIPGVFLQEFSCHYASKNIIDTIKFIESFIFVPLVKGKKDNLYNDNSFTNCMSDLLFDYELILYNYATDLNVAKFLAKIKKEQKMIKGDRRYEDYENNEYKTIKNEMVNFILQQFKIDIS